MCGKKETMICVCDGDVGGFNVRKRLFLSDSAGSETGVGSLMTEAVAWCGVSLRETVVATNT